MPLDPTTGVYTPLNPKDVKRSQYVTVPILVGAGISLPTSIRADIADYFGIVAVADTTGVFSERKRRSTGRMVYASITDLTGVQSKVTVNDRHLMPKQISGSGGGRVVIVPTELTTPKGNIRTVRMHFPSVANLAAISNFLATKCVTKTPTFFKTLSGVKRAVGILPVGKDPNVDLQLQLSLPI